VPLSDAKLRDWFAAQAINATVTHELTDPNSDVDFAFAAKCAYRIADAMMKAREQ